MSTYVELVARECARIDAQQDGHFTIYRVHNRLDALSRDEPDDIALQALSIACGYHSSPRGPTAPYACGPFGPVFVMPQENGVSMFPKPLDRIDVDVLDLWSDCASEDAMHPIVRARLGDLLWVRRHRGPRPWFRVAVPAYLELMDTRVHIVERTDGLVRAADICREASQRELLEQVLDAADCLVGESLDRTSDEFGIVMRGLLLLADNGRDCTGLVAAASEVYRHDPWDVSQLREVSIKIASSDSERSALQAERVGAFEAVADAAEGLLRFAHLTTALEIAESAGLAEDAQRLRHKLENTDPLSDAQTFEVTHEFDLSEMKAGVDAALGTGDLRNAILGYGALLPVGDPEQTRQDIAAERSEYPWQSLVTKVHIGPHGSASVLPSGHEMRDAADLGSETQ